MRELDVLLGRFLDSQFDELSIDEQRRFAVLLEEEDPSLFGWLNGRETHPDPVMQRLIDAVRDTSPSPDRQGWRKCR